MEELPLYEAIMTLKKQGEGAVLVTVVDSSGSTPRKAGAKMLVRADGGTMGTIGGGRVEIEMIETAAQVLRQGRPRTAEFFLDERSGLVCGGRMLLYLEPIPAEASLLIVGKGHISQALEALAGLSGYRVASIDPPESDDPGSEPAEVEKLSAALKAAPNSAVIIATPSHPQDFIAARAALNIDAPFIGMIGSRRKRNALDDYLRERGIGEIARARIISPVGLDIGAETPAEIAVSILAQLVERRRKDDTEDIGAPACRGEIAAHGPEQTSAASG